MLPIQKYRSLVDSFGSNWAPAFNAAIADAERGETIDLRQNDGLNGYQITEGITVTKPSIRFLGRPRDGYAMSIRCGTPGVTMFSVKATGVVFEDLAMIGDVSAVNGVGATVNGIELVDGVDGDLDSLVKGCTFQWMATPVRLRGRNATVKDCLFSNSLGGIVIDGKDATYHTGPNADQNRGNLVFKNRFPNIGANANNSAIEITSNTKVLHAVIEGNHFDSTGGGRYIKATGTAGNMHGGLTFLDNKHTEAQADAYHLTYVQNSKIVNADISAFTATTLYGSGIVLANCDTVTIVNPSILQMGNSGIVSTSGARIRVKGGVIRAIGGNPATVAHGLDFNAGNTQCRFDGVSVEGADGYGFNGDPADSEMTDCEFRSCTLGNINSLALRNRASNGRNVYVEGTGGRKQDSASKSFDLADGVATPLATITGGTNYSSLEVEVKVIGRNSAGHIYARYVRPENGAPQYVTPIADVAQGTITLAFGTSGTSGTSARGVTVTMA
jgi:hypothetical protein